MKKQLFALSILFSFFIVPVKAITFTDDFESYTAGVYLAQTSPDWTTWTGVEGGSLDVKVTAAKALSGVNSIYFASSLSAGGPQDVILPFGGTYNSGMFTYEMNMFVESNKGAYFNFQGSSTMGDLFPIQVFLNNLGGIYITNSDGQVMEGAFPNNAWFNLRFDIDLNTNTWELFIDNVSQGSFCNDIYQLYAIDIYPVNDGSFGGNNQSGFYIDDVSYTHTPYTPLTLNGAVNGIFDVSGLATQQRNPTVTVRNLGTTTITSFDLTLNYNGNNINQSVSSVNIASMADYQVTITTPVTLAPGSNTLTATVSNINGTSAADDFPADDSKFIVIDPIVPAAGKVIVIEEGTGTWCGYCPRGAVLMDLFAESYEGFIAGIAVHNKDPMTHSAYDLGLGTMITGYPKVVVDRGLEKDPLNASPDLMQRLLVAPVATIQNGANWNSSTRELTVSLTYNFQQAATSQYKVACVIVEDSVTGTSSGYNQSNYYSGGGIGVMGGFENLPNPVPASQMNYNHVARAINPSFTGYAGFPSTVSIGELDTFNFSFLIDATWDINQIHIIGMLIDPSGRISNGSFTTVNEAVTNGFQSTGTFVGIAQSPDQPDNNFQLFPNPSTGLSFMNVSLDTREEVAIIIRDITGRVVAERNYGQMEGAFMLPINTSDFTKGIYIVELNISSQLRNSSKLVVQ